MSARCYRIATLFAVGVLGLLGGTDANGACYRRKDVVLSKCSHGSAYDTYTLTRPKSEKSNPSWALQKGVNCFHGHGAETVPPEPYAKPLALEACKAACAKDSDCTAIVYGAGSNAPQVPAECFPPELPMGANKFAQINSAQIKGPAKVDPESVTAWLAEMKAFRPRCQQAFGWNGGKAFDVPELSWTQTAYISPQMHAYDRFFFDPALGNGTGGAGYTVDKWLGDLNSRYGGIDKALIWPTYTNIGIDDRNTFDLIRSMPGGAAGIKVVVEQLHARGVKVLWPYHPWDHSTKGQEKNNVTDFMAMAELLRDTGADGFNGDTMDHIPKAFYDAATSIYKPIALEAEKGKNVWDLNYVTVGWAEGWEANEAGAVNNIPDVDKSKWLSDGKVMTNWCDRWAQNKISELQVAWFNGLGYESWENVWGTWNGITDRDGEAIRRVGIMLRYFGARGFLQSSEWVPHTTDVLQMADGIFGSAFPSPDGSEVVYTLVNRMNTTMRHATINPTTLAGSKAATKFYDCYNGVEATVDANHRVAVEIDANGFGCLLATANTTADATVTETAAAVLRSRTKAPPQPATLAEFLQTMRTLTAKPLSAFSPDFHYLQQEMIPINQTVPLRPPNAAGPDEVYVPGAHFAFNASGVEIEGGVNSGVDVQYPWDTYPHRHHSEMITIEAMYVDKFPVTNAKYASYLKKSNYHPLDSANWLKQNFANGAPVAGWEDKPVTYVSLEDARAYCAFQNKRLPHVFEWQYFAQGTDGRLYPWGSADNTSKTPPVNNDWVNPGPEAVGQYPDGASPFGVQDLVRSVWQYTTEFQDIHTRSVILRGGANYNPWRGDECRWIENNDGTPKTQAPACFAGTVDAPVPGSKPHAMGGSHWYFPPAYELNTYNKYFLMSGSYDRAGTIGFRCVADAHDRAGLVRSW